MANASEYFFRVMGRAANDNLEFRGEWPAKRTDAHRTNYNITKGICVQNEDGPPDPSKWNMNVLATSDDISFYNIGFITRGIQRVYNYRYNDSFENGFGTAGQRGMRQRMLKNLQDAYFTWSGKRLPYATLLELNWKAEVGRYWWCRLADWRPFWGKATEMRAQLMVGIRNYWINRFYSVELPNIKKSLLKATAATKNRMAVCEDNINGIIEMIPYPYGIKPMYDVW
tara:strand:- start:274 stop:954 length:681 start_codon:yes stop_codon:yes gene_type:complete